MASNARPLRSSTRVQSSLPLRHRTNTCIRTRTHTYKRGDGDSSSEQALHSSAYIGRAAAWAKKGCGCMQPHHDRQGSTERVVTSITCVYGHPAGIKGPVEKCRERCRKGALRLRGINSRDHRDVTRSGRKTLKL
jgi:hypothetical protein